MKWIKLHSIKTKLLVGFSLIVLLMFGLLLVLNQLLLDDFFLYVNQKNMTRATRVQEDLSSPVDYFGLIGYVTMEIGGQVFVYNEDGSLHIGDVPVANTETNTRTGDVRPVDNGIPIDRLIEEAGSLVESGYSQVMNGGLNIQKNLIFIRKMPDGRYLVVSKGLGIIDEASSLFVLFLGMSSLIVYLIGFVLIYLYAERFTKPIRHLKVFAERMAALDFGGQLAVTSEDEMGDLVHSVNEMAEVLSSSIEELNASNFLLEKELNKERTLETMRRRFITDVSHELKNPISMVIGYADGIERGLAKTPEDRMYYARVIQEEGKRMNRLVKDLLDISSYTSGTFKMSKTSVDVAGLLKSTMDRYRRLADDKEVTLVFNGLPTAVIRGDLVRLEQVVTNLLDNALKHVDHAGVVMGYVDQVGDRTKMVIANTGPLIPEKEFDAIWESFYQIDTDSNGNGLGLTIVKSIVEMHGGSIGVYVTKGMNHFEIVL